MRFTDGSSNSPTSWAWDFGDGGASTGRNPTHTYLAAGAYTVSLTATNAAGSDSETKQGYLLVTPPELPAAPGSLLATGGAEAIGLS